MSRFRFRGRWLYPGDGPPISEASVTVESGRIVAIDDDAASDVIDLGQVAIIPGLLNAHTHLEFSDLETPLEPRHNFADWIAQVITSRRTRPGGSLDVIRQGLRESLQAGTNALGEIATSNWLLDSPDLRQWAEEAGLEIVLFREILGLREDAVEAQLEVSQRFLEQVRTIDRCQGGISPHAPYSLHPRLFEGLLRQAREFQVPVAMHLAESAAELELLDRQSGPLVELLRHLGLWRAGLFSRGMRPIDFLRSLAELPRVLVVHGNFLDDEEIGFLANQSQMSVVYCPRTHAAMGHPPHPWQKLREAGIPVALGTDSRASNPDLSIWQELRFLHHRHSDLPASALLQMATANAARALGLNHRGRISPDSTADLLLVRLPVQFAEFPEQFLFEGIPERLPTGGTISPD